MKECEEILKYLEDPDEWFIKDENKDDVRLFNADVWKYMLIGIEENDRNA